MGPRYAVVRAELKAVNVTCDKCNKRYAIADEKVRGKSVKIRCKQCQNLISVQGPPAGSVAAGPQGQVAAAGVGAAVGVGGANPWEEERTRAMPAMDLSPTWFAMVKGKQIGPLTVRDLEARVKAGEVSLRTYLWKQGMADWKRASEVPEVSPVFAGVSVGAAAVGPVQASPQAARPSAKSAMGVTRDVATANEVPSPEITRKPNGNGHGPDGIDPMKRDDRTVRARPFPSAAEGAKGAVSAPKPSPVPKADNGSEPATQQLSREMLIGSPASARPAERGTPAARAQVQTIPGADAPEPQTSPHAVVPPELMGVQPAPKGPLGDLFSDVSGLNAKGEEKTADDVPEAEGEPAAGDKPEDPFAALGEADPKDAPPPGEATKFFIAQAGVNKRNPPWKIALFVGTVVALPLALLFMLSKLHVVPPVLVQNDKGEMVEQEFFSPSGFSTGIRDLLSGEAKRKRAEAERQADLKKKKTKETVVDRGTPAGPDALPGRKEEKKDGQRQYTEEELARLYGTGGPTGSEVSLGKKADVGPKIRFESEAPSVEKGGGLDAEAVAKTMNERMKGLVGCVEDALKRNPNVKLEKCVLVLQVGTSGAVKAASLEPKRVELTDWGSCLRERAKKITFPPADSESEVQIPLVLGASMQ